MYSNIAIFADDGNGWDLELRHASRIWGLCEWWCGRLELIQLGATLHFVSLLSITLEPPHGCRSNPVK
jgi:hypothetical protein